MFEEARARRETGQGTLLFVDEIHRFNRAQQDSFLPVMEDGTIVLVGATTENPSFELIAPMLSRARVLVFKSLDAAAVEKLLARAEAIEGKPLPLDAEARASLIRMADGDGRASLTLAEEIWRAARPGEIFDSAGLQKVVQRRAPIYDKKQDGHYNLISALHKSVRGSDPDAALYYLARMLDAGEDPLYLARRVVRMAVEDIGLADPQALVICNAAKDAYDFLGSPEGELAIAEAVIYVATAPKSNAAYVAYGAAKRAAKERGSLLPPKHILNAPTDLMKSRRLRPRLCLRPRRRGGVLRPGLFPGGTRPPDVLRSARARLRARNQEAPGLLGEASQGKGWGLMLQRLVLAACAIERGHGVVCARAGAVRRPLGGQARGLRRARRRHAADLGAGRHRHLAVVVRRLLPDRQDVQGQGGLCAGALRGQGRRAGHARRPAATACG